MGTTYTIKVIADRFSDTEKLPERIEHRLAEINKSMSTYLKESEISNFNRIDAPSDSPFEVSKDFLEVMQMAKELHSITDGAWDGTVDPLINLWGFGRDGSQFKPPENKEITSRLEKVGFDKISITKSGELVKKDGRISVSLASIAKGYGVDSIATLLKDDGFTDFLVEIGGEVYAAGRRLDGSLWRVGITPPKPDAGLQEIYKIVSLKNRGFATSGDYRNYFEWQGKRYGHILDPRTGYPVTNGVVSVSVVADSCALADGLATAIMVMGPIAGIQMIEQKNSVEAFIVVQQEDGKFKEYYTTGFEELLLHTK